MRVYISSLLSAVMAIGCSSLPQELPDRGEKRSFSVQAPSDLVFRKVTEGARNCYAKREVVADFFPDNKSGRVSMSVKTRFNVASLFLAEIKPDGQATTVDVFFLKGNPVFAEAVEQWTAGNYSLCPFA